MAVKEQEWRRSIAASPDLVRQVRCRIMVLEACGMPRYRIAQRAGVARSTITRLARVEIRLSRATAQKLLAARPG